MTGSKRPPLVSILTPSYNQGEYVKDTIDSVLRQDYPAIEHIVVDGGSTDRTIPVLKRYGDRVHVVSEPDGGQADALNKAFARSSGGIVGWLNSDDFYVSRDVVRAVVDVFSAQRGVGVVYGHAIWVDRRNRVLKVGLRPRFDASRLCRFDFISQPATFFRRSVIQGPLVDDRFEYALDYALWLQLADRKVGFHRIEKVLAGMRTHAAAKSVGARAAAWHESAALAVGGTAAVPRYAEASDLALMLALKLRGLAFFRRRAIETGEATVQLSLPSVPLRPLFQFGLLGEPGTTLLLPRELWSRRKGLAAFEAEP